MSSRRLWRRYCPAASGDGHATEDQREPGERGERDLLVQEHIRAGLARGHPLVPEEGVEGLSSFFFFSLDSLASLAFASVLAAPSAADFSFSRARRFVP